MAYIRGLTGFFHSHSSHHWFRISFVDQMLFCKMADDITRDRAAFHEFVFLTRCLLGEVLVVLNVQYPRHVANKDYDNICKTILRWVPQSTCVHDDVIKWKHFRVTSHLCGEFTGHRWIPCTKASNAELWCSLWSASEKTIVRLLIWDAIAPIVASL